MNILYLYLYVLLQQQLTGDGSRQCVLECGPDMDCHGDTCCGSKLTQSGMNGDCAENGDGTKLHKRSRDSLHSHI